MKRVEVKEGERYGRLTIIREVEPAGSSHKRVRRFLCRCDCGNEIICRLPNLKSGTTKSCGCYRKFVSSNRRDCHHLQNTRIYRIWCGMKRRCYNKHNEHFDRYGGRGIIVCDEWKTDFMNFYDWAMSNGFKYNNVYQSGYAFGNFVNDKKELKLDQFVELDRGFDFYAPQTFEDAKGRRIMIGWMGVPDAVEHKNPTVENYWQHQLTLPRELKIIDNKLYQLPLKELETLRKDLIENKVALNSNDVLNIIDRNTFELRVDLEECSKFNMKFREDCVLSFVEGVFKLTQGKSGYGRKDI